MSNTSTGLLHLTSLMQKRLSRELRDSIHKLLWDEEIVNGFHYPTKGFTWEEAIKERFEKTKQRRAQGQDEKVYPFFVRKHIVGQKTAFEAAAWYYDHHEGFKLTADEMSGFLEKDLFDVGLSPAESKLRSLTITFNLTVNSRSGPRYPIVNHLAQLTRLDLRRNLQLEIIFEEASDKANDVHLYSLAKTTYLLEPYVSYLDQAGAVPVKTSYQHGYYGKRSIKHMLKAVNRAEWMKFFTDVLIPQNHHMHRQGPLNVTLTSLITDRIDLMWNMDSMDDRVFKHNEITPPVVLPSHSEGT